MSRIGQCIEAEVVFGGYQGLEEGKMGSDLLNGFGVSFWGDEHVLELDGSGDCTTL